MESFTIKTPADVLSFVGHTLGFLATRKPGLHHTGRQPRGATLHVDLPKPGAEISYAQTVAGYLAHDAKAASIVFALYTGLPAEPGRARPHAATIAALTGP